MIRFFARLFSKSAQTQLVPIELHPLCGERMDVGELKAALETAQKNAALRALLQMMHHRRCRCVTNAMAAAWQDKPAAYDLGGAQALDELFGEVVQMMEGKQVPDAVRDWFTSAELQNQQSKQS